MTIVILQNNRDTRSLACVSFFQWTCPLFNANDIIESLLSLCVDGIWYCVMRFVLIWFSKYSAREQISELFSLFKSVCIVRCIGSILTNKHTRLVSRIHFAMDVGTWIIIIIIIGTFNDNNNHTNEDWVLSEFRVNLWIAYLCYFDVYIRLAGSRSIDWWDGRKSRAHTQTMVEALENYKKPTQQTYKYHGPRETIGCFGVWWINCSVRESLARLPLLFPKISYLSLYDSFSLSLSLPLPMTTTHPSDLLCVISEAHVWQQEVWLHRAYKTQWATRRCALTWGTWACQIYISRQWKKDHQAD